MIATTLGAIIYIAQLGAYKHRTPHNDPKKQLNASTQIFAGTDKITVMHQLIDPGIEYLLDNYKRFLPYMRLFAIRILQIVERRLTQANIFRQILYKNTGIFVRPNKFCGSEKAVTMILS